MAWIDVTSRERDYDGAPEVKNTINTNNVAQLTDMSDGRCLIFFACSNAHTAIRLEVKESREEILRQIREQDGPSSRS